MTDALQARLERLEEMKRDELESGKLYPSYPNEKSVEERIEEVKQQITLKKKDSINPTYYKNNPRGLECIDAIEAATWRLEGLEAVCTGQIIRYIWRWKQKGGVEDLRKAQWYLEKLISENSQEASDRG